MTARHCFGLLVSLPALCAATVGVVACSSFSASAPDVPASSSDGGADGGPSPEASVLDAPTPDASKADAAAKGCARYPMALVCDDFDDGHWDTVWQAIPADKVGLSIVPTGRSAPDALAVTLPANAVPGPHLTRGLSIPANTQRVQIDFQMSVDAFDTGAGTASALAAFGPTGIDNLPHVRLELGADRLVLVEYELANQHSDLVSSGVPTGWSRVSIVVDYSKTPPKAELLLDGTSAGNHDLANSFPRPTAATAYLGLAYLSGSASAWSIRFDDYVVTVSP